VVHPGDIIIGDGDGLLAVRPWEAAAILEEVAAVGVKEAKMMADIEAGTFDISWVDAILQSKGCQI
jgi:regulator of RNase E activity RraA